MMIKWAPFLFRGVDVDFGGEVVVVEENQG